MAVHCSVKTTHSEGAIRLQVMQSSQVRGGGQSGVEARLERREETLAKYEGSKGGGFVTEDGASLSIQADDAAFTAAKQSADISWQGSSDPP